MRNESYKVYKFDELPESGKISVYDTFRHNDEFYSHYEIADSLKGFTDYFGLTVSDYEYQWHCHISFTINYHDFDIAEMQGVRLWKYLKLNYPLDISGECPFTGVCYDENLIDKFRDFITKPDSKTTFESLMSDCLHNWLFMARDEYEYWNSPESIKEDIEANEYEFTENGQIH